MSRDSNGSQLKKLDISSAILTLSLSIRILNSQCAEGARCKGSLIDSRYIEYCWIPANITLFGHNVDNDLLPFNSIKS